ncbi:VOC family protein [Aerococcaceae bacterium NML201209]|nr:VOC family protein [Aerococcaceae bacterium NML201209]
MNHTEERGIAMSFQFNAMIPELYVFDIEATKEFYLTTLEFTLEYQRPEEKFVFLSFGDTQMMFEELYDDGWNTGDMQYPLGQGVNFSIEVKPDIEAYYQRLKERGVSFYRELTTDHYDVEGVIYSPQQFIVQDPSGYLLRFTT